MIVFGLSLGFWEMLVNAGLIAVILLGIYFLRFRRSNRNKKNDPIG